MNCLCLGGKWWLLFHLLQIILYNNWHITTLVDSNTIFYKALYKQFESKLFDGNVDDSQLTRKGEKIFQRSLENNFDRTWNPNNIKAINQIFINLLDSLTIKTVQWISSLQLLTFFPPLCCFISILNLWFCKKKKNERKKGWMEKSSWMLYNKLCFPLLINLFGIFRLEMRRRFSMDVNVSWILFFLLSYTSIRRYRIFCISTERFDVEIYENFNLFPRTWANANCTDW